MGRRRLVHGAAGLAIGAVVGVWSGQPFTEAGLGLAAGVLLSFTTLGAHRGD